MLRARFGSVCRVKNSRRLIAPRHIYMADKLVPQNRYVGEVRYCVMYSRLAVIAYVINQLHRIKMMHYQI